MFSKVCRVAVLAGLLVACARTGDQPNGATGATGTARSLAAATSPSFPSEVAPTTPVMERMRTQGGFASAPDKGELVDYAPRGTRRDGAYTWHRADVSEEHALRAVVDGHLHVPTPSGRMLDIVYDRMVEHDSGDWTWIGHLKDDPGAQTILTFGAKAVFGAVGQVGQRPLRLTTQAGAAWMVETDAAMLRGLASKGANPTSPDYLHVPRGLIAQADGAVSRAQAAAPSAASASAAAATTVDVVIGYTSGLLSQLGSTSAVTTRLNYLVDVTNTAYVNSQVNARVRLVHAMKVSYTDTNDNGDALEALTGYDSDTNKYTTPDAKFKDLRAARETYGADLVSLVRPFRDPEQNGCGIAWLVGGGKRGIKQGDGQDYFGYSVVSDGEDENADDGKTYYCRDESFAHELGHNMGSAHDRATAEGDDGKLDDPDDYGAYTYSFGYKTSASAGNFYTIMAYGDDGQTSYRVFSNPRITTCGGKACGTTKYEDNARSIGNLIPVVATFRSTAVPLSGVPSDFNGDGKSDILWRNYSSGRNRYWSAADGDKGKELAVIENTNWFVAGVGDFSGDGKADILWRNKGSDSVVLWKDASQSKRSTLKDVSHSAWKVAGVGDLDGDGRDDILWRSNTTGENVYWSAANSSSRMELYALDSQSWVVAGIGDFNSDGRDDILWRNMSDGRNVYWNGGAHSQRVELATQTDKAWKIVGVGDFNGDGKADILWRNAGQQRNRYWSAGKQASGVELGTTDSHWSVAQVADFNGDGKSDILWHHTNGNNIYWSAGKQSSRKVLNPVPDTTWHIVP